MKMKNRRKELTNRFKRILAHLKHPFSEYGYGVHSPVAFYFITHVIHEKTAYYAYHDLLSKRTITKQCLDNEKDSKRRKKVDELLFRLVNYVQPEVMWQFGLDTGISACYLHAAKKEIRINSLDDVPRTEQWKTDRASILSRRIIVYDDENVLLEKIKKSSKVSFVHFNRLVPMPCFYNECAAKATNAALFVIEGIHATKQMEEWWFFLCKDERVGTVYDLYDVGLLLFAEKKIKMSYTINF